MSRQFGELLLEKGGGSVLFLHYYHFNLIHEPHTRFMTSFFSFWGWNYVIRASGNSAQFGLPKIEHFSKLTFSFQCFVKMLTTFLKFRYELLSMFSLESCRVAFTECVPLIHFSWVCCGEEHCIMKLLRSINNEDIRKCSNVLLVSVYIPVLIAHQQPIKAQHSTSPPSFVSITLYLSLLPAPSHLINGLLSPTTTLSRQRSSAMPPVPSEVLCLVPLTRLHRMWKDRESQSIWPSLKRSWRPSMPRKC